MQTHEFSRTLL